MNKVDLKQIQKIVQTETSPIKKILDNHSKILNKHSKILNKHSEKLDEHSRKLDALLIDMVTVQQEVKALPDIASKLEKVDELEERVEVLETATKF